MDKSAPSITSAALVKPAERKGRGHTEEVRRDYDRQGPYRHHG